MNRRSVLTTMDLSVAQENQLQAGAPISHSFDPLVSQAEANSLQARLDCKSGQRYEANQPGLWNASCHGETSSDFTPPPPTAADGNIHACYCATVRPSE